MKAVPLRQHDFRLLWIGETTSAVGTSVSKIALPLVAAISLKADAFQVSALTAAAWLPWLLFGLPVGAWVDRLPRRPLMQLCDIASLSLMISVPVAAWAGVLTITQLLTVALLTGGTAHGMLACEIAGAPFALLIPLASSGPGLAFVVIGGIGVGAGIVSGNVIKGSFRQTYTPRHLLGRVIVSMQFLNYGSIPLGALASGTLASTLGLRPTMWIMAGLLTAASTILLIGPIRRQRDLPGQPGSYPLS
jgi:hypothetical protein